MVYTIDLNLSGEKINRCPKFWHNKINSAAKIKTTRLNRHKKKKVIKRCPKSPKIIYDIQFSSFARLGKIVDCDHSSFHFSSDVYF